MLAALRYRRAQSFVLVVLSALVTTCLVIAPLYTRALEQATVRTLLGSATTEQAGLRLSSYSSTAPSLPLDPDQLAALVPAAQQDLYGPHIGATSVTVRELPLLGKPQGTLLARDGMCEHVRFASGRCPTGRGEVAVTTDQARAYAMPVGSTLSVGEWDTAVSLPDASPRTTLKVVGVYDQVDGPYWFGDKLSGTAATKSGFDTMLTPQETLTARVTAPDGTPTMWFEPHYAADLPLLTQQVGIDRIGPLGASVASLVQYPMGPENAASQVADTITVRSGLPAIAAEIQVGGAQARVTIPLLMAQMGLLLVCVLWLVLVAASDQRRGEVAVARLRGRGSRGARRLLLGETLPPIVAGVPLGALVAVAATTLARRTVLQSDPPFEVPSGAVVAVVASLALMVLLAVLSVRRVTREPVATLTRSVPPRQTGIRLGVLEAMLVAMALAAFLALVTGAVGGVVGQVAPTLLALAVGIVAARVMAWVLSAGGRRLLRGGRVNPGTALLTASRRGTTRWLIPVVTVALCLIVVTTDALAVGVRAWAGRAAAEVGAPAVLTLDPVDLAAVVSAVREVDPSGLQVTPVALVGPKPDGGTTTVGVVPESFRQVALWPGVDAAALPMDRLTAPTVPPLELTGTRVTFHVTAPPYSVDQPVLKQEPTTLLLALQVVRSDGTVEPAALGPLPGVAVDENRQAAIPCADGCRVIGIGVLTPPNTAAVTGGFTVTDLAVDGRPVDLGGESSWRHTTKDVDVSGSFPADGGVQVAYQTNGFDQAFLTHGSVPDVVPALTTPPATPSAQEATFGGSYVDGTALLLRSTGEVTFVPGAPASSSVVNLDNLLAQGWRGRGSAEIKAYLASSDPAFVARVTSALAEHHVKVTASADPQTLAAAYAQTAAAWSLQLALAVGVLSLIVAGVGIIVLASTSSRARTRDYAALRLVGHRRRGIVALAQLETVPVIVVAAALGIAVGLWAAPAAVGMTPLFTTAPPTFPVDLHTAYGPAVVAGAIGLLVLALVGVVTSRRVANGADVQRLRDTG